MRNVLFTLVLALCELAIAAESTGSPRATGVTISEQANISSDTIQSLHIRKMKHGYDVLLEVAMPCAGKIAQPWLGMSENPTLVIQKENQSESSPAGEWCMYSLTIAVAENRLTRHQTLYVVSNQQVVGHVSVP